MPLTTISGAVIGIRHSTSDARVGFEAVGTYQVLSFRVGGLSAQMRTQHLPDIQEGDLVTLSGRDKKEAFEILALRNERTGSFHSLPVTMNLLGGVCIFLLGLPLSLLGVGIPMLALGPYLIYQGIQNANAAKMLQTLSSSTAGMGV